MRPASSAEQLVLGKLHRRHVVANWAKAARTCQGGAIYIAFGRDLPEAARNQPTM